MKNFSCSMPEACSCLMLDSTKPNPAFLLPAGLQKKIHLYASNSCTCLSSLMSYCPSAVGVPMWQ